MSSIFEDVCERNGWDCIDNTVTIKTTGGRSQTLHAEYVTEGGDEIMRIYTNVGPASGADEQRMRSALTLNFRLRYGAIAIREAHLVLVDTFLIKDADHDEVKKSVHFLAQTADQHERLIYGTDDH